MTADELLHIDCVGMGFVGSENVGPPTSNHSPSPASSYHDHPRSMHRVLGVLEFAVYCGNYSCHARLSKVEGERRFMDQMLYAIMSTKKTTTLNYSTSNRSMWPVTNYNRY